MKDLLPCGCRFNVCLFRSVNWIPAHLNFSKNAVVGLWRKEYGMVDDVRIHV